MKKVFRYGAAVALFGLVAGTIGMAGPISGPTEFPRDTVAVFDVKVKGMLKMDVPAGLSVQKAGDKWYIAGKPGAYKFEGTDFWVDFDKKQYGIDPVSVDFTIKGDGPVPPTPPGPNPPGPTPPPEPNVRKNPFSDDDGRVMILFDPLGTPLTSVQNSILYGEKARTAMTTAAKPDGVRIWPKGQASSDKVWAAALQRLPASYPWIMVGKGQKGYEGPLPSESVDAFVAKLNEVLKDTPNMPPVRADADVVVPSTVVQPACRQVWTRNGWVTVCQ